MKRFTLIIAILLIIGHALTELHSYLLAAYPQLATKEVDPFLKKDFKQPILFLWYIKFMTEGALWMITYFCMALVSYRYSLKLFLIVTVYFFYHAIDQFLFAYDYKRSYMTYWALLSISISVIIILVWPIKKKTGIYKSIE